MPRAAFDKIIETGYIADQYKVAKLLKAKAKEADYNYYDEENHISLIKDQCGFSSTMLEVITDELINQNISIDEFLLSDSNRLILKTDVYIFAHSVICERCSFALANLLSHLDKNGIYIP